MQSQYTQIGGISKEQRALLSKLHRGHAKPFTPAEAAETLRMPRNETSKLLVYWASRGWLSRVTRGHYVTVPLEARNPSDWPADPWVVASTLFDPCYIGGWSAAEHWDLTEQIFSDVVVYTSASIRERRREIQGTVFVLTKVPAKHFFGLETVWREQVKIQVSNPSRTLVDLLDKPFLGGGIDQVALVAYEYFQGEYRNDEELGNFAMRLGNKTIFKRLGFLIETLKVDAADLLTLCRENLSAGYSKLDPSIKRKGRFVRKWKLEVNAGLRAEGGEP